MQLRVIDDLCVTDKQVANSNFLNRVYPSLGIINQRSVVAFYRHYRLHLISYLHKGLVQLKAIRSSTPLIYLSTHLDTF